MQASESRTAPRKTYRVVLSNDVEITEKYPAAWSLAHVIYDSIDHNGPSRLSVKAVFTARGRCLFHAGCDDYPADPWHGSADHSTTPEEG